MKMQANVKLRKGGGNGPLASAEVVLEGEIVLRDITLWPSKNGGDEPRVSFPSRKYEDREGKTQYMEYFATITKESRVSVRNLVLEAFAKAQAGAA